MAVARCLAIRVEATIRPAAIRHFTTTRAATKIRPMAFRRFSRIPSGAPTSTTPFGSISGRKEAATDDNYSGYLAFATITSGGNASEKMRISSGGNVGIGTTAPGYPLTVQGVTQAQTTVAATTYANRETILQCALSNYPTSYQTKITASLSGTTSDVSLNFELENGAATTAKVMTLTGVGNVGIGTTAPYTLLDVSSTGASATSRLINIPSNYTAAIWTSTNSTGIVDLNMTGNAVVPKWTISLGGTPTHAFLANGNVGIGTTAPGYPLTVQGVTQAQTTIAATTYATRETILQCALSNYPTSYQTKITASLSGTTSDVSLNFELANGAATTAKVMTLTGVGNVGIGTTAPYTLLDVSSTGASATSRLINIPS